MYRAAVVVSVAALDSYVHGVVLDRAVDVVLGRVDPGAGDRKFGLPLPAVRAIATATTDADRELAAKTYVAERLSLDTFQFPDDVGKALAMVGVPRVWSSVFGTAAGDVKQTLSLVVRRRNAIAHQCDSSAIDPSTTTEMLDIDAIATTEAVTTTIDAIHAWLKAS